MAIHGHRQSDHGESRVKRQQPAAGLFNDRRVMDNVAIGALADGKTRAEAEEVAAQALRSVGLENRLADPVRRLSGGEMQRVVIARALASARPFVLADEPTGQLDTHTTQHVLEVLLDTTRSRGLLTVTHDAAVAERCDRTFALSDGKPWRPECPARFPAGA